jgi:hypothetical protein
VRDNQAARSTRLATSAFERRDWDVVASMFSGASSWVDNRPGLASELTGRDEIVRNLQTMSEIGARSMSMTLLETRGEYLALFRGDVSGTDPDAFGVVDLTLVMVDAEGLVTRTSIYEPDQLADAVSELESLYHG